MRGNALRARGNACGKVAERERASPEGKVAAHKVWKRRLFYVLGALANHMDGVIRVVGRAPLRWPDRVVGAAHRGHKVE